MPNDTQTDKATADSPAAHGSEVPTPRTDELRDSLMLLVGKTTVTYHVEQFLEHAKQLEREVLRLGAALNEQNERWGLYGNESQAALRDFKELNVSAGLPNDKIQPKNMKTDTDIQMPTLPALASASGCDSANDDIQHGDACPECGGCVRWNEAANHKGLVLQCDECSETFAPSHNAEVCGDGQKGVR